MKNIHSITSAANPLIRLTYAIVHTQRRAAKEGLFTVEGLRLAEMAAASDWKICHAFVTEQALGGERGHVLADSLLERDVPVYLVTEKLFSTLSETDSPQGSLLVMERKHHFIWLSIVCRIPATSGQSCEPRTRSVPRA